MHFAILMDGDFMYYVGICKERGICVKDEFCLSYAVDRVLTAEAEQKEFIEWFYSGNWIKIENGDEKNEKRKI